VRRSLRFLHLPLLLTATARTP